MPLQPVVLVATGAILRSMTLLMYFALSSVGLTHLKVSLQPPLPMLKARGETTGVMSVVAMPASTHLHLMPCLVVWAWT